MLAGGRWNAIGTPMLYTAQHLSLACLEVLVHLDKAQLPREYVWSQASLSGVISDMASHDLTNVTSCQTAGTNWARVSGELAIRVPSVIIPGEFNVLLNPSHIRYRDVQWSEPKRFGFDPRLFATEPQPF